MKRLQVLLWILALVLIAGSARAQTPPDTDVNLAWQPSVFAAGYKVHWGTASATYTVAIDAGDATVFSFAYATLPRDCTRLYAAVTAYNAAGESGFSLPVSFYSRPLIDTDPDAIGPTTPGSPVWEVNGTSFGPDVTFAINGTPVPDFVRDSCTKLTFLVAQVPGASDWTDVQICNPAYLSGQVCSSTTPIPKAPGLAPLVN